MSAAEDFQTQARWMANRAADRLQEAADKLRHVYDGDPLPSDTMHALEVARNGMFDAYTCIGKASHQHALAVLHKERSR